jgi:hypothetical protein
MHRWQIFLFIFAIFNFLLFIKAYKECKKKNVYGLTKFLYPLGMFVWGDVFVFSIFWTLVSLFCVLISDLYLFFLIASLFGVVRSFGETIYWFNQQFSNINREAPERIGLYAFFQNDSVWFVQQIKNQCMTVIYLVLSIYFGVIWVKSIF